MSRRAGLVWLLAALLLANLLYFLWTQGGLALFGSVPASLAEREPQRMAQQIRPDALQIRREPAPDASARPPAAAVPAEPPVAAEPAAADVDSR